MNAGFWVWPTDAKRQRLILRKISQSEHLMTAIHALAKSPDGLSNAKIDDALSEHSHWGTRWVVEQLISLGFADYKVDFFGGPGNYVLTELGRNVLSAITGKPAQTPQAAAPPPKPSITTQIAPQTK